MLRQAHDELVAQGYLRDVRTDGARANITVTYDFASLDDPDPALVRLLVEAGVGAPQANKLARERADRIEDVVAYVRGEQNARPRAIRKPGALIFDMLTHPEKYVLPEHAEPQGAVQVRAKDDQIRRSEEEAVLQAEAQARELLAQTPQEQWRQARPTLKILLAKHLPGPAWEAFERACLDGRLLAGHVVNEFTAAQVNLTLQPYIEQLRAKLRDQQDT